MEKLPFKRYHFVFYLKTIIIGIFLLSFNISIANTSVAASDTTGLVSNLESESLGNTPNYDWWYGCSPTAVGMIMGYYDRYGYNGYSYDNLVKGGTSELNSFPSVAGNWDYLCQNMMASQGHVNDFYSGGYGASGDDTDQPYHEFNCLADFMGTSQDSAGNANGATTFWNYENGDPLSYEDIFLKGYSYYNSSGMYGIYEYVDYCGYSVDILYNQYIDTFVDGGFTYTEYMAEIDAGRPVLIHLTDHSIVGYGYFTDSDTGDLMINVYDTFDQLYIDSQNGQNYGTLSWGGQYLGLDFYGVTVMALSPIPAPGAFILVSIGIGCIGRLRRNRKY